MPAIGGRHLQQKSQRVNINVISIDNEKKWDNSVAISISLGIA